MINWIDPLKFLCSSVWEFIGLGSCVIGLTSCFKIETKDYTDLDIKTRNITLIIAVVWFTVSVFLIYNPIF